MRTAPNSVILKTAYEPDVVQSRLAFLSSTIVENASFIRGMIILKETNVKIQNQNYRDPSEDQFHYGSNI